ncbi:hypothetical protein BDV33DRAFT_197585 [Aspergillus novoparasiticus]|uniref:Carrier domain-containing protein n=1 Tax=Aspergillus novoparasiticus TaxID=986946 RepID=A0A5N6F9M1_9EURO|nr:hypothetical protein BDV33DRAFT_197585 [Aspergillus novoparasiticus]
MEQPQTPVNAGQRLLTNVVDEVAQFNPQKRVGVIPNNLEPSQGFRDVSFGDLARAVNALSWWIEKQIGKAENNETVAYMGRNDILYLIFILACNKTGYKPLLPSGRLSNEAYQHILGVTECRKFFYSHDKERQVSDMKEFLNDTDFYEVPATADILNCSNVPEPYPFIKTFAEAEDDVAFIIHSSGTTGMPKPVPLTHGFVATLDSVGFLPIPAGRRVAAPNDPSSNNLVLVTTPFFHLMGLYGLTCAIFHNTPFVNLPDKPVSVDLVLDTIRATNPTITMLAPAVLEDISQTQAGLDCLGTLNAVIYAGAPLAADIGNRIVPYTKVVTLLGSSEMGIISSLVPEGDGNWGYFEWNPAYGVEMQHRGEGLYEFVIPRRENSRAIHGIFHTFPDKTEYASNDLFVQHPSNPTLWKYHGRFDDVIVLSNGEKLNPVTLEKMVECHPKIGRAVVIGQGRFQTSLLVEPHWNEHEKAIDEAAFIDEIWSIVERANETVPNYGRITKTMIKLSSPEKPFKTTPKGTTQRRAVNRDYKEEIDAIYASADQQLNRSLPEIITLDNITQYVNETVCSLLERETIDNNEDLYSAGLDSLQTIQLATILRNAVSCQVPAGDRPRITAQHIYAHSTVTQLAVFLLKVIAGDSIASIPRHGMIQNMVAKYTEDIPTRPHSQAQLPATSTVILTGSTGSLGAYLLHTLLTNKSVSKVYCFNRSDAQSRQIQSFKEKGLDASPLSDPSRVEFLKVSFGEPHFGIDDTKYTSLLNTVDLIIHNAWKVNFNHPLESFEDPHIKGVREFISFSLESKYNAHLSFVSSVATVGAWTSEMGAVVPELPLEDDTAVLKQGYGESKHVSERMCVIASKKAQVPTTIFRVGQIAGPTTKSGLWNPDEWLPTIVATSKALGKVPSDLGSMPIDWVPVDKLAQITVEALQTRRRSLTETPNAFFHLMNPNHTAWSSLIPAIESKYNTQTVPFGEWISDLESIKNPSDQDVREKPALKLLDFYRGLLSAEAMLSADISVERTKVASETMKGLGPISVGLMENWIEQWGF